MPSRMERYYDTDVVSNKNGRSQRNAELYRSIYETAEYSNIEGIASIEKNNEIDISKVQEMLKNREAYKKQRQVRPFVKEPEPVVEEEEFEPLDDKRSYDIRDILNKAKVEHSEQPSDYRNLKNTQYNILKNINLNNSDQTSSYEEPDREEVRELIDTITNTSLLNKMGDKELSLDLFEDLKSTHNTMVGDASSIRKILDDERHSIDVASNDETDEPMEMDKSFYTSSFGFTDDDFEELKDVHSTLKKNNLLMKIFIFVVLVVLVTVAIYFGFDMIKNK